MVGHFFCFCDFLTKNFWFIFRQPLDNATGKPYYCSELPNKNKGKKMPKEKRPFAERGDCVQLRGNLHVTMVVSDCQEEEYEVGKEPVSPEWIVLCEWFDSSGKRNEGEFCSSMLKNLTRGEL